MIDSAPTKILIGIPLDQEQSMELLSWAINNLARPNDTIVALHVLVLNARKKRNVEWKKEEDNLKLVTKYQMRIRKAKSFVVSVMGEFANGCCAKQVNLEAKVGFSSSVGKELVEEAKTTSALYLLLGNTTNRISSQTQKYCREHIPKSCTLVSVEKRDMQQKHCQPDVVHVQEFRHSSSRWLMKIKDPNEPTFVKTESEKRSPKNVLDLSEKDYHSTEEDSSSFEGSSVTESPSPPSTIDSKPESSFRKHVSSLKRLSTFLRSPFDPNARKKDDKCTTNEKHEPLLKCFGYEELAKATNNFHPDNIAGIGGYSEVYKGDLENGESIAVKKLAKDNKDQNKEKEFLMELGIHGHVNHPNTASLVGCCVENGLYLIFNYYPNGTLSTALHGKTGKRLKWPERYKIAIGIAQGLHYLHTCCKHRIIHRDIKASNILLGPDCEPQISDFGLAKWLPSKWTHHAVIPIEGTFGYLAPEYFMHGIVDEKTDVYAFGVLLLEIITGRMPVDSDKQNLVLWAKPLMESEDIDGLADPNLEGEYDSDEMYRLVVTSLYCVRQSSIWRPSMTEVLELLRYGNNLEIEKSMRIVQEEEENEMDDYSMIFGYDVPLDISLDDI